VFQFIARHSKDQRYTPEFKKLVVETMMKEKLSYSEAARQFEINDHKRVAAWERIYLEEGPEGFVIERRGRGSKSHPPKQLSKEVEGRLLALQKALFVKSDKLWNRSSGFVPHEHRN